jgi:hypothetical protein
MKVDARRATIVFQVTNRTNQTPFPHASVETTKPCPMKNTLKALAACTLFIASQVALLAAPPVSLPTPAKPIPTPPAHSQAGGVNATALQEFTISQTIVDVGTLSGTLTIESFIVDGGVIKAESTFTGKLTATDGTELASVSGVELLLPLTSTTGTTAENLHLELGSVSFAVGETNVTLAPILIDLDAESSSNKGFPRFLALASRTLDRERASLRQISHLLNLILRLAQDEA